MSDFRMTAEERSEAEGWVLDCEWADEFDVSELSDVRLRNGIERNFVGGWAEFVRLAVVGVEVSA